MSMTSLERPQPPIPFYFSPNFSAYFTISMTAEKNTTPNKKSLQIPYATSLHTCMHVHMSACTHVYRVRSLPQVSLLEMLFKNQSHAYICMCTYIYIPNTRIYIYIYIYIHVHISLHRYETAALPRACEIKVCIYIRIYDLEDAKYVT